MGDAVEVPFDVGVHHPVVSAFQELFDSPECVLGTSSGSEAVTLCGEVPFEDWFNDVAQRCLHHSITHHRYSQWSLLGAARFGYPHPFDCCRLIALGAQFFGQLLELWLLAGFETTDTLTIYSGTSRITPHFPKGALQVLWLIDLVDQGVPLSSFDPCFQGPQHRIAPHCAFHPFPSLPQGFFVLFRLPGGSHFRRFFFAHCLRFPFHLPASLCSTVITPASLLLWTL